MGGGENNQCLLLADSRPSGVSEEKDRRKVSDNRGTIAKRERE